MSVMSWLIEETSLKRRDNVSELILHELYYSSSVQKKLLQDGKKRLVSSLSNGVSGITDSIFLSRN